MKYAVEMGLDAMIYVQSFIKTGLGIQKLIRGDSQTDRPKQISASFGLLSI
jgi:hypothetical protein